jgi:hypothetical protein
VAVGDALDQVLSGIDAAEQERRQRRVPAPNPAPSTPVSGPGRAASLNTPPRGGPSFFSRLMSGAGRIAETGLNVVLPGAGSALAAAVSHPDVVPGVAAGILRSPLAAAGGIADFGADVAHAVGGAHADPRNYQGKISRAGVAFRYSPTQDTFSGFAKDLTPLGNIGNETANEVSAQMASLAIGYGAGSALAKVTGLAPKIEQVVQSFGNPLLRGTAALAARAGGASLADAVVMDPETERFSNLLQQLGVHTQFTDWLAHDDKEGHLAGRFKNSVEGLGLGAAADTLLSASSYWRARLRGDNETADAIQRELARHHDGEVPDLTIQEHPGELPADKGEPGYVGGWEEGDNGAIRPVYEEDPLKGAEPEETARAADDGVEEEPAGGKGSTGGPVKPIDPKAMAKAMGDPEAGAADSIVSFTAKRTADDPERVIGSIDRGSIDALAKDVESWRLSRDTEGERELDVTRQDIFGPAADHGEFRIGNIGGQSDVAPLLRAMVDRIPESAPRSDADLFKDAARASAEIGEDPASLLEASRLISGKLADADTAMVVLRTVWKRAADDLDNLTDTNWQAASDADVEQAAQRVYNMMAISSHVQEAKAGLGRGLRVNQLPDADTYLNTVRKADHSPDGTYGPSGPLPRTRQEIADWFDLWQSTRDDPELRSALLEGALTRIIPSAGKYLRASFANFFTASVLSAPKTLLLNLGGPAIMSVIRNVERQSGAMIGSFAPWLSAAERQQARSVARATAQAYFQTFGDISDAMKWAWVAAQKNKSIIGGGGSIDAQSSFGPWTPALLEAARPDVSLAERQAYSLGNMVNMWPRAIARINNGFDEFSKRLAYMGEVRVRAITEGLQAGLEGDDLRALVKERLLQSTNDQGHAAAAEGVDALSYGPDVLREAERTTLTAQIGDPGSLSRGLYNYISEHGGTSPSCATCCRSSTSRPRPSPRPSAACPSPSSPV